MTTTIPNYQQIIVAVDFSESSKIVAARALDIAQKNGAEIMLIHAVEYLSPLSFGDDLIPSPDWLLVEEELVKQGEKSLQAFAKEMGMDQVVQQVPSGPPIYEIVTAAKEKNADLIVVGAHGRRGLQRLLGSTANSVINHATCDVLAVRFQQ